MVDLRSGSGRKWVFKCKKPIYLNFRQNYISYGEKLNSKVVGSKKFYNFCIYTFFT